ncbi:protein phosphatase 2C domain-containing protein [Anabaena sphaerica]|uniref:protein phosphatase 2C domain-containing protein n=1 Tax=Anabaena sphaerica TaxID=212446 RepID=UPI0030CD22AB
MATPEWVAAMQIGDGFIVMRCQDAEYQILFKPDKGEFFNETTFVTSVNALEEMQVEVFPGKQGFICASTDGLEKVQLDLVTGNLSRHFLNLWRHIYEKLNSQQIMISILLIFSIQKD